MKYIKEYNNEYYQEITIQEFSYMLYPDNPPNSVDFTKDEVNILKELDKKHDYDFTIHSDTAYFQFIKENWWIYFTICKKKDEWYIIESQELQDGLRGLDKEIIETKRYKCDQFEGLCEFLKDMLMKYFDSDSNIKKIKESNNSISYQCINPDEWCLAISEGKRSKFIQQEIDAISSTKFKVNKFYLSDKNILSKETSIIHLDYIDNNPNSITFKDLLFEISIAKIEDEWFFINYTKSPHVPFYKCDQLHGLIECLKFMAEEVENKISMSLLENLNNTYYKLTYTEHHDISNRMEVSNLTQNEINKIINSQIKHTNQLSISHPEKSLVNIDNKIKITIQKLEDEWFTIADYTGSLELYKCDQIDGVIDCMDYLYKKHDEKINESNYFYKDKPPSLIDKRPIKINYRDVTYLNNALGNYMKANNKNMEITPIPIKKEEYIRIYVEPTALPITMRGILELVKYEFEIYNMDDEWYSVHTRGNVHKHPLKHVFTHLETYWCDQIDGVAKYIKHKIEELYPID